MAIILKKGQGVSLKKNLFDLSKVTIGLGWDVSENKSEEYDLDVIAFLIGENGKVNDLGAIENGRSSLKNGDIVFFGNLKHHSGQVWLTGDDRTGGNDGDNEQIIAKLNSIPEKYIKIIFAVHIYKGIEQKQNYSKVKNAVIRAVDALGREMVRFDLTGNESYANYCSLTFAEFVRENSGDWKFNAIGIPHEADSFIHILKQYI